MQKEKATRKEKAAEESGGFRLLVHYRESEQERVREREIGRRGEKKKNGGR